MYMSKSKVKTGCQSNVIGTSAQMRDCADTVLAGREIQSRITDGGKEPW